MMMIDRLTCMSSPPASQGQCHITARLITPQKHTNTHLNSRAAQNSACGPAAIEKDQRIRFLPPYVARAYYFPDSAAMCPGAPIIPNGPAAAVRSLRRCMQIAAGPRLQLAVSRPAVPRAHRCCAACPKYVFDALRPPRRALSQSQYYEPPGHHLRTPLGPLRSI